MAIDIRSENGGARVDLICSGRLTGKELCAVADQLFKGDYSEGMTGILLDYHEVEQFDLVLADFDYIARHAVELGEAIKVAVVTERVLAKRLTHLWQALARNSAFEVAIYATVQEAEEWLSE